jgi:hypothetical protein
MLLLLFVLPRYKFGVPRLSVVRGVFGVASVADWATDTETDTDGYFLRTASDPVLHFISVTSASFSETVSVSVSGRY